MTKKDQKEIQKNNNLWKDIKVLYNAYIKPTKKSLGLQSSASYPFLFKGRFADLIKTK